MYLHDSAAKRCQWVGERKAIHAHVSLSSALHWPRRDCSPPEHRRKLGGSSGRGESESRRRLTSKVASDDAGLPGRQGAGSVASPMSAEACASLSEALKVNIVHRVASRCRKRWNNRGADRCEQEAEAGVQHVEWVFDTMRVVGRAREETTRHLQAGNDRPTSDSGVGVRP